MYSVNIGHIERTIYCPPSHLIAISTENSIHLMSCDLTGFQIKKYLYEPRQNLIWRWKHQFLQSLQWSSRASLGSRSPLLHTASVSWWLRARNLVLQPKPRDLKVKEKDPKVGARVPRVPRAPKARAVEKGRLPRRRKHLMLWPKRRTCRPCF